MKSVSRMALGVALAVGSFSLMATQPAEAQRNKQAEQPQMKFSKEERAALSPLQTAVDAKDWAAFAAALPAAQAAAQSANAKYAVARFQLDWGVATNNVQAQTQAIDGLIASGVPQGEGLIVLYQNQGALAVQANNNQKAETAFARLIELQPGNLDAMISLATVKLSLKKPQEAVALVDRAIAGRTATGGAVPESWYRYALKLAFDGKMGPQSIKMGRALVSAYPTTENWRDVLLVYRETNPLDKEANLDLYRLMRAAKALSGERDWFEFAETLQNSGFPGEAKAVLEEGASMKMIDLNKAAFRELLRKATQSSAGDRGSLSAAQTKAMAASTGTLALSTANAYFGYGDYAQAATLYRAAISKGGVDVNLANTRLGMALALAGNKADAEAAFRSVSGARTELAAYWMAWLARRA